MHLTRQQVPNRISIRRKGTKYVARALSHLNSSVPVVIALRDILKIAKTKKEVEKLVQQKLIKINNRVVQDIREPVIIFNILGLILWLLFAYVVFLYGS
jgi:small subunit ribosomal protein S4e